MTIEDYIKYPIYIWLSISFKFMISNPLMIVLMFNSWGIYFK